jgi:hypothetical protein
MGKCVHAEILLDAGAFLPVAGSRFTSIGRACEALFHLPIGFVQFSSRVKKMNPTPQKGTVISSVDVAILILFVVFCSWFEYTMWISEHTSNMDALVAASDGVLNRMPHWRAYQNRILAPYLVDIFRNFSQNPYSDFAKTFLTLENLFLCGCAFALTRKVSLSVLALIVSSAMWVYCKNYWSYPWDFTESIMTTLLFLLAVRSATIIPFVALFICFALSRESVVFVGLFLFLRGVSPAMFNRRVDTRALTWGAGLAMASAVITETLRKILFKASMIPGVGADARHASFENHIAVLHNGKIFFLNMITKEYYISIIYLAILFVYFVCAYVGYREKSARLVSIGITMTLYVLSIFVFGAIDEARLYQPLAGSISLTVIYLLSETESGRKWRATNLQFLTRRGWN